MRCSLYLLFLVAIIGLFQLTAYCQDNPSGERKGDEGISEGSWYFIKHRAALERRALIEKLWSNTLREFRRIDPTDTERYKNFLVGRRTGIFRFLPNFDCVSKNVIKIDGECTEYVPESSDFSFRSKTYADPQDHDIGYVRDEFVSNALFSQGILVALGDVPIEEATLGDIGLKFLVDFQPDGLASAAHDRTVQLQKGIQSAGFIYSNHLKAVDNTTYALRFVGYRYSFSIPWSESSLFETNLALLDFSKRMDTIVVFRVIRRDPHGNLTIVWKELSSKKASKLKFAKGEKRYDFKK